MKHNRSIWLVISMLVLASMLLSACGPSATPTATAALKVGVILPTKNEPRWIQDETRFKDAFTQAGYDVQILFSDGDSAKEKANVESLISQGVKVIIFTPQDGTAAAAAAQEARDAGVKVISYDRLIRDTAAVDYYVTFDSVAVGEAQGQYLVDKATGTGNPLYLYAGAATDNNAFLFFEGAWNVLQPKIADGTFVIKNSSEAVGLQDKATLTRDEMSQIIGQVTTDWKFDVAKNLAEANLTAAPAADKGDVFILAPNDGTARAIADSFAADGDVTSYVVTGQDAEEPSVQYIIDGKQSMTVLKDVRTLVSDAIAAAVAYLEGGTPEKTATYNNGAIDVPAKPSVVVTVDQSNVQAAVIDSGYWPAADFTGLDTLGAPTEAPTEPPVAAECPEGVYDFGPVTGGPAGGFLEQAVAGAFAGTTVTVDGTQVEPDDQKMKCGWKAFEEATGITVNYIGNKEFEARLSIAVDAGQAPDIADFPQPGVLARYAEQGKIVDVNSFMPADYLSATYNQAWLDMATMAGPSGPISAGVWNRGFMKSLVWYAKDDFDASGYTVPQTWDELVALSDQIVADGGTPWCVGIESQAATGWVATDWVEDIMLRTTSLENYDKWVAGTLPFASPEVKNAFETIAAIWFKEGNVFGGRDQITTTFFADSPAGLFTDPPNCFLHRQASFITGNFPADAEYKVDYDFFYLPPIDDAYGRPALGAADIYAAFNDRPEVKALMEYLSLPMSVSGFMNTSGALALQNGAVPEMYANAVDGDIGAALAAATSFRFDASDLMPGEVGAGSFWKGATDWASGAADLDTVLQEIDASWPK